MRCSRALPCSAPTPGTAAALGPNFGVDPQARLDYGYQAVEKLTPMAKSALQTAYGKSPDRSYFGGCSNGGRHTMVAAARFADQYDGYLAGAPGYNLPKAAIANIFGAQRYATVATNPADLATAFTPAERTTVANAVLARCDALDGATDGLVQDTNACQAAFSLTRDVPTCSGGARRQLPVGMRRRRRLRRSSAAPPPAPALRSTPASPTTPAWRSGGIPFWEFIAPLFAGLRRGRHHLRHAARQHRPPSTARPLHSAGTSTTWWRASTPPAASTPNRA